MRGLSRIGWDLRHIPIGPNSPDDDIAGEISRALSRRDFCRFDPTLRIWHQHDLLPFYGKGEQIGFPIFELEKFSNDEVFSLNTPDRLIVCSEWAKRVMSQVRNDVSVVPLGYDEDIFVPTELPNTSKTIFANFGKFEKRKGHDILPLAFNLAFEKNDDVALVMMPHNFFLNQEETNRWVDSFVNTKLGDKITFVNRVRTHKEVFSIMKQVHCGVFPSRAEGWNLEALELLACGRHVIITNCTAHTEFCDKDNCRLIEMESGFESNYDGKFFNGSGEWRKFGKNEIDQLVNHLREVHKQNTEGSLKMNKTGVKSVERYSWTNASNILSENINGKFSNI
jgi:glycosyltransferase involved in cell wall biosynthesis